MAVQQIPSPNPRDLLPPLLACLATATAAKQPPDALLPLCSNILAQKLRLLASDDWISLLCWDKDVASRLPSVINSIVIEPHPVSGEIEIEDPVRTLYRRSDPETLHSRMVLTDLKLVVQYLWCTGGDKGDAWKLAELRGLEDEEDGTEWYATMEEANDNGLRRRSLPINRATGLPTPPRTAVQPEPPKQEEEEEDDDAYWAAYDRTPGRTPARTPMPKRSPAPYTYGAPQAGNSKPATQAEQDYFARYADEVQPAMDPYDPDEDMEGPKDEAQPEVRRELVDPQPETRREMVDVSPPSYNTSNTQTQTLDDSAQKEEDTTHGAGIGSPYAELSHPRASSPSSVSSVEKLEREARKSSQAEIAIKQHISTDMKSLFRLARSAGIDREEFERIIHRELEVLPMLEEQFN